jgi:endonuclease/exonuclease/phosphatase family metal-dependent hydrolase
MVLPGSSSFATELARRAATSEAFPRGASVKTMMYDAYLADIQAGATALHDQIPTRPAAAASSAAPSSLRVMSYNVHFFQRGYSGEQGGDNRAEVSAVIAELQPDVILLQELCCPADWAGSEDGAAGVDLNAERCAALLKLLNPALGYAYATVAPEPDVHVLPESLHCAPGVRLAVGVLSRLPLLECAAPPLGGDSNGSAARAVVELRDPSGGSYRLGLYSVHLSVRCPAELRLEEVQGVVRDADAFLQLVGGDGGAGAAAAAGTMDGVLLGGDFNQPCARDYPPEIWAAMAQDMAGAKLPLCDGVAPFLRGGSSTVGGGGSSVAAAGVAAAHGDWVTSFDDAGSTSPGTSAWNGAMVRSRSLSGSFVALVLLSGAFQVDFLYRRRSIASAEGDGGRRLKAVGAWVYYTAASDHLPLVADYEFT